MAININADTTNGLVITSDNSGEINFQNAGSTVATLNGTGLTMGAGMTIPASALTGTLPSIDASSLTNIPAANLSGTIGVSHMPTGSILKVQHNVVTTNYTGTSSSNVDFPAWSFSFTPQLATSKVLVMISVGINMICDGRVYLKRNGTIVKDTWFGSTRSDDVYDYPQAAAFYLDSPSTTSAITYQVGGRATGCSNIIRFGGSDNHASMTFMEVAG